MPPQSREEMRCPTCGAREAWSETCRRCKCDLRLLRKADGAYEQHRRECLRLLSLGFPEAALRHGQTCQRLFPAAESERLVALCQLLLGNWAAAWERAMRVFESERRPAQ